jgi:hypothetical protein
MSAPEPLHPATLAAHLKRKGFKRAEMKSRNSWECAVSGFAVSRYGDRLMLRVIIASSDKERTHREELDPMIAALAPEFEVAQDLRNRVVVRRAVKS